MDETSQRSPAVASPPDKKLEQKLRKAQRRLAKLESQQDELATLRFKVAELRQDNSRLRATLESLREARAAERSAAAGAVQRAEAPEAGPVVEAPRRRRAQRSEAARVGVFVDVANVAGAARRLYGGAVDYRRLLATLLSGRRLVEARAYAIDKGSGFSAFARALGEAGYKVAAKVPKIFPDGSVKADWDVGIATDLLTLSPKLDVAVLCSGDGDFVPVVRALKHSGLRVEAAGFAERTAEELVRSVDLFVELDASALEAARERGPG